MWYWNGLQQEAHRSGAVCNLWHLPCCSVESHGSSADTVARAAWCSQVRHRTPAPSSPMPPYLHWWQHGEHVAFRFCNDDSTLLHGSHVSVTLPSNPALRVRTILGRVSTYALRSRCTVFLGLPGATPLRRASPRASPGVSPACTKPDPTYFDPIWYRLSTKCPGRNIPPLSPNRPEPNLLCACCLAPPEKRSQYGTGPCQR